MTQSVSTLSSTPLLSIVIPSYNAMPFISETLQAICDWPPDLVEIVVQDGASTDGTLETVRSFGDRIKLESKKDRGQADALNRGIRRATGKYIGWLNADDLYMPEMWPKILPLLADIKGPDALYGDYSIIYANGDVMRKIRLSPIDWTTFLYKGRPVWSGATLWNARVFEEFGYFDDSLHYCMDAEFFLRVAGSIKTEYVSCELGRFRIHDNSKTGSAPWAFFRESHRIRWQYAGKSTLGRTRVLIGDAKQAAYYLTTGLRQSRMYSRLRPSHHY